MEIPASFFCCYLPLEAMQHAGAERGAVIPRRPLLLALAIGILVAVPVAGLTLTIQDRSVAPNGTVVVQIVVADAQDLGGADLTLTYDPAVLRFESAAPGSLADRDQVRATETGPGRVAIAVASPRSITGNGPIVALTFVAVGSAGMRSPITLGDAHAVTVDGDAVPVQVVNGTVSVGGAVGTPLSLFGTAGALAVGAAAFRRARAGRRSRDRQKKG